MPEKSPQLGEYWFGFQCARPGCDNFIALFFDASNGTKKITFAGPGARFAVTCPLCSFQHVYPLEELMHMRIEAMHITE